MAFQRIEGIGGQAIDEVSSTQQHPFGTRIKARDATLGEAEFVYVKGVASGARGLFAKFIPSTGVTTLTVARTRGLVGVMMAALVADTYGWLQVVGESDAQVAGPVVAGATPYLTATAGKVDDAVVAGDVVYGANFATADGTPEANWARVSLANPSTADTDNV